MYIATARSPQNQGDGAMKIRKQAAMKLVEQKLRLKIGSGFLEYDNITKDSEGGFCHGMCSRKVLSAFLQFFDLSFSRISLSLGVFLSFGKLLTYDGALGVGVSWDPPVSVDLTIALESLQPLLRNDLSPSERLLEQFLNAITLVHETLVRTSHLYAILNSKQLSQPTFHSHTHTKF